MANEAKNVAASAGGPSPYTDPTAYLQARGWKCLGEPSWPSALWVDPEQPQHAHYRREPIMAPRLVQKTYRDDADGREKTRVVEELQQVMAQDGRGGYKHAERLVFHPKAMPVSVVEALQTQIERDAASAAKREKEKERAR